MPSRIVFAFEQTPGICFKLTQLVAHAGVRVASRPLISQTAFGPQRDVGAVALPP